MQPRRKLCVQDSVNTPGLTVGREFASLLFLLSQGLFLLSLGQEGEAVFCIMPRTHPGRGETVWSGLHRAHFIAAVTGKGRGLFPRLPSHTTEPGSKVPVPQYWDNCRSFFSASVCTVSVRAPRNLNLYWVHNSLPSWSQSFLYTMSCLSIPR